MALVSFGTKDLSFLSLPSGRSGSARLAGNPVNTNDFEQQLETAIRNALVSVGLDPGLVHVRTPDGASQNPGSEDGSRQFVVTVGSDAAPSPEPPQAAPAPEDPKSVLAGALKDAGMDPSQYGLSLWSETVYYPGGQFLQAGSYVNNFINVDLGAKGKFDFSSDLMVRDPQVTVREIQDLLKA